MGKDKKWMEKTRAVLSCSRGLCGEYDGSSQSRKNPKTSDGKYLADPLRNNGKTRDDRIYRLCPDETLL